MMNTPIDTDGPTLKTGPIRSRRTDQRLIVWLLTLPMLLAAGRVGAGQGELIFADGFEHGHTLLWSRTVPPVFLGECAAGEHLQHRSGLPGIFNPDTFGATVAEWAEYSCVADEVCERSRCSSFGACQVVGGEAVCACLPGYAGDRCERCAVGYEVEDGACVLGRECGLRRCSDQGSCVDGGDAISCICDVGASGDACENGGPLNGPLRPPTRLEVDGIDTAVEPGEERRLTATPFGGGNIDTNLQWRIARGPGTLLQSSGLVVTYRAPFSSPDGGGIDVATIEVIASCCPDDVIDLDLTLIPLGGIGTTGVSKAVMKPLDQAILDFMRYRCIGGATLGVNVFGKQVYTRGFGSLSGAPTSDSAYLAACGDQVDVSDLVPGHDLPPPAPVLPTTPMRIGSNSKALTAAMTRKALKEHIQAQQGGLPPSDDEIESTLLVAPLLDLLPPAMLGVMRGEAPPLVPLFSLSGNTVNCSSSLPCPYGGQCTAIGLVEICVGCPAGRSGFDCSIDLNHCPDISQAADSRWAQMRVGHLLGHTSGMPHSVPDIDKFGYPNLGLIRNRTNLAGWLSEELDLTSETGFPDGDFDSEFPAFPAIKAIWPSSIFPPRISGPEAVGLRLGACLAYSPDSSGGYSNTNYGMLGIIAEHVSGQPLAATDGKPGQHTGSLLHGLLADDLGLIGAIPETAGMIFSQNNLRRRDPREPIYRTWNGDSYYEPAWDVKRPHCRWLGSECSFEDWIANPSDDRQKPDWDFPWDFSADEPKQGLSTYTGAASVSTGAAGGLAATPAAYLRFMAKFWVGGDGSNPRYGETRCPGGSCIWNSTTTHNGARGGTESLVMQLGPKTVTLHLPPIDPATGRLQDDFADLHDVECDLPAGVDVFVTLNTSSDKKCSEADDYSCSAAYDLLKHFVLYGVCSVGWPANPFALWPPELLVPATPPSPELETP
ncbi:MAG TPA: serine hydrolase [Thermoanaerobaculia bacterium]|jgi:hypothetical protein